MAPEILEYLNSNFFEWKELKFYNSRGEIGTPYYEVFLDKLEGYVKLVERTLLGGNYGPTERYLCVVGNTVKLIRCYGDSSGKITDHGTYKSLKELIEIINQEMEHYGR